MKFREQKGLDPVAILNEFDVHDMMCNARAHLLGLCKLVDEEAKQVMLDQCGCIDYIKIVPERPEYFTESMVAHWEHHLNILWRTIQKLDGLIHEDAGYTC